MIFVRRPKPVTLYDAGDLYRIAFTGTPLLFQLREEGVRFHKPDDKVLCIASRNSGDSSYRQTPRTWLERPFRECPFNHPHYNHGNTDYGAPYYFIVKNYWRGSDHPETCINGIFIPSGVSKVHVVNHMRRTLRMDVRLSDVDSDLRQETDDLIAA